MRACVHVKIKEYLLKERKSYHVTEEKSDSKSQITFYQQRLDPQIFIWSNHSRHC